jgi:cell wall assembly regulator SMI1
MTPEEVREFFNRHDVQLELKRAERQAKETIDRINEASRIRWEDLHKPMTI